MILVTKTSDQTRQRGVRERNVCIILYIYITLLTELRPVDPGSSVGAS